MSSKNIPCRICGKPQFARGLCKKHYWQERRHGEILDRTIYDPNEIVEYDTHAEIILYDKNCNERSRALISLHRVEQCKQYKWHYSNGYVAARINGMETRLSRFIMGVYNELMVDHKDHNTLNNMDDNLRICTNSQNQMNMATSNNSTTGIKGITLSKAVNGKPYCAYIQVEGDRKHLGYFSDINDAIIARLNAEKEYFGQWRYENDKG